MTTIDIDHLRTWIGREESATDVATLAPVEALSATLDRDDPRPRIGDELPPLWHWLYFLPKHRQSELGPDGHAQRGGFLPPIPLPRRMWAGSRLTFHAPISLGAELRRVSRVKDVTFKEGRSGPLVFLTVSHEIQCAGVRAISEEHDLVFRENPRPDAPPAATQMAPTSAQWSRAIHPDDVLLFRYSALTFNPHRIHYDRRYCTDVEGYPGLVVHGPLLATLLLDLLRRNLPEARVAEFSFRAMSPIFDTASFSVNGSVDGSGGRLWATGSAGELALDARVALR